MTTFMCAVLPRLCISAVGRDAGKYLQSQSSNDIESLDVGQSRYAFLLEPTGKVIALVRVTREGEAEYLIDTDDVPDLEEMILTRLNRFKIRVDVTFSVAHRTVVAIRSLDDHLVPVHVLDAPLTDGSAILLDTMWGDERYVDVLISSTRQKDSRSGLDVQRISDVIPDSNVSSDPGRDVEEARVRAGWPAMSREIEPGQTLAAATGVTQRAVSFTKGCYPGQELVERMDSRGSSAPRALRRFRTSDLVDAGSGETRPGDSVYVDGRDVGTVTSVAGDWALAYIARGVDAGEPINPVD